MNYALGSFPRFGHQARWAGQRRARAIANSILTRQIRAQEEFEIEIAFHAELCQQTSTMHPLSAAGDGLIAEMRDRLDWIRRRHVSGRRVYYRHLGETLLRLCEMCGAYPELKDLAPDRLKEVVRNLGLNHMQEHWTPQGNQPTDPV